MKSAEFHVSPVNVGRGIIRFGVYHGQLMISEHQTETVARLAMAVAIATMEAIRESNP